MVSVAILRVARKEGGCNPWVLGPFRRPRRAAHLMKTAHAVSRRREVHGRYDILGGLRGKRACGVLLGGGWTCRLDGDKETANKEAKMDGNDAKIILNMSEAEKRKNEGRKPKRHSCLSIADKETRNRD